MPTIQFLRGSSLKKNTSSKKLLAGQPFYETDTNLVYVGNGGDIKSVQPIRSLLDSEGNVIKDTYATNTALNAVSTELNTVKETYAHKKDIPSVPTLQDILGSTPIGDTTHHVYWDGTKFVATPTRVDGDDDWYVMHLKSQKITSGQSTPEQEGLYVGQEYIVPLSTGEEVTFVILGFNHDDLADGSGKAGITFGMKDLLRQPRELFSRPVDNEISSWELSPSDSKITSILLECFDSLPKTLRDSIKSVKKTTTTAYEYYGGAFYTEPKFTVFEENSKLFLFSFVELGGRASSEGKDLEFKSYVELSSGRTRYPYYNSMSTVNTVPAKGLGGVGSYNYICRDFFRKDAIYDSHRGYCSVGFYTVSDSGEAAVPDYITTYTEELNRTAGICFGFCI